MQNTEKPTAETTTPSAPTAPTKKTGLGALSDEDWLMMGLNMLQAPGGQTGNALSQLGQNIGRSGLATLGARREREKMAVEQAQKEALSGYYKGMTEQFGKDPETIRTIDALMRDPKRMAQYREMERIKDETRANAVLIESYYKALAMNPALEGQEGFNRFVQQYQSLNGGGNKFKVVGSRPQ